MREKTVGPMTADNPFFGSSEKANWARLTRLGGDRVSILLDHLRKRVGVIEGLSEEVIFDAPGEGADASYRVGEEPLFTAHVAAGALEVSMCLDAAERETLLASRKISPAMRRGLLARREEAGKYAIRFAVKGPADVGSIVKSIVRRSRTTVR